MNKRTKSFLLSILTLSFIFYSCSSFFNDLQKRKNQNLFNITIQETSNGTVTVAKSSGIKAGEEVILSVTATSGYELKTISVTNTQNKDVAVAAMEQGTSYKFTMPASDVTVGAAFDKTGPVDITEPGDLSGANGNTIYRVEHYQQDVDDTSSYTLYAIQKKKGDAGTETAASAKDYPGFTSLSFTQKKIAPDGSTVVEIYYNRKTITYTFDPNGGNWNGSTEPVTVSGLYGAVVNVPDNPDVYGFTFIGWDKINIQLFEVENQTITACWDADEYTSYTIKEYRQTVEGGDNYTLENEYEIMGTVNGFIPKTLHGFNCTNIEPLQIDSNGNGFINVYYDRKYYTVSFVTNGGNSIPDQQILYGTKLLTIPTPVKEGYTFYKWYYEPNCDNRFEYNKSITDNTILYAFWIYNSITYKFHETVEWLPAGTDGTLGPDDFLYVLFGDYPQSKINDKVTVDENKTLKMGDTDRTVYEGSDGYLYYKYSGTYYKIEPIKWCVIDGGENRISVLLAENILDISAYGQSSYESVYTYSLICYFLQDDFLPFAFSTSAQRLIKVTTMDSDTTNFDYDSQSYGHFDEFSEDKIYLLKSSDVLDGNLHQNDSRIRTYTGFSAGKRGGTSQGSVGWWWLRSSFEFDSRGAARISSTGNHGYSSITSDYGVVPALSIYLPPAN